MLKSFSVAVAVSFAALAGGQTCDQWATDQGLAAHGGRTVDSIIFDDGTGPALYVAGTLDGVGAGGSNAIAKWDGTRFVSVGGDVPGTGAALAIFDEDGPGPIPPALYLTGSFQSAGGVPVSNIARWNGSAWSALGGGLASNATALAVYDDGQGPGLVVGGYFTSAGGSPANHLAMWRGGAWSELGGGVAGNASVSTAVNALAVFNGALYVGGSFVTAGSLSANSIVKRQNGAWSNFAALGGAGGSYPVVQHLLTTQLPAIGPALVAAGVFNVGSWYVIAAWTGTSWSGLGVTSSTSYMNPTGIGVFDSGSGPQLLASGYFGQSHGLIAWNGTSWDVVAPAQGDRPGGINTMTQTGPGTLFVGGSVTQLQGVPVPYAAMLQNGAPVPMGDFAHGFDASIYTLQNLDAGDGQHLYAAGSFRVADGRLCAGIVRQVGGAWVPLAASLTTNNGDPGTIRTLAVFNDGSGPALYAGGSFLNIDGVAALNIARWRPASGWEPVGAGLNNFPTPTISSGGVYALCVHDDGGGAGPALCAAGNFTYTGTASGMGRVARWTGSTWSPIGTGVGNSLAYPLALASFDEDGAGPQPAKLWLGGKQGLLKRWDGVSWTTPAGAPTGNTVAALFPTDAGGVHAMYAGGDFTSPFHACVAVFTGQQWAQVGQSLSPGFVVDSDTTAGAACFAMLNDAVPSGLCVGGAFYDVNNYAITNFAILRDQQWTPIEGGLAGSTPSFSATVRSLANDPSGQLWAGGTFSRYYFNGPDVIGAPSSNIALLTPCRRCTADYNGDGDDGTDADIEAFFACLAGNCCAACTADFNGDGDNGTDADIESFFRVLAGGHC